MNSVVESAWESTLFTNSLILGKLLSLLRLILFIYKVGVKQQQQQL